MVITRILASYKTPRVIYAGAAFVSFIRRNGIYVTAEGSTGITPVLSEQALSRLEKIISR